MHSLVTALSVFLMTNFSYFTATSVLFSIYTLSCSKLISDLKVAEDERLAKETADREADVEAHSPVKEDAAEDTGKGKKGSAGK